MLTYRILCGLALFAATQATQAAYVLNSSAVELSINKSNSGNSFSNAWLMDLTPTAAAQVANYKELKFDVTMTQEAAAGNFGFAWNTDINGSNYNGFGEQWLWNGWSGTFTYDYSANTPFMSAAASRAQGNGGWFQIFGESNWPDYNGTNKYNVTQVYLDSAVPEPAMLSLAAVTAGGLLARRRKA